MKLIDITKEITKKVEEAGFSIRPTLAYSKAREIVKVAESEEDAKELLKMEIDVYLAYMEEIRNQNGGEV